MLPESVETLYDAWGDLVPWGFLICSVGFLLVRERKREVEREKERAIAH